MIITNQEQIKIGQKYKCVLLDAVETGAYIYMGCGWTNPKKKSKFLVIISSPYSEDIGRLVHSKSHCHKGFWEEGFVEIED